MDTQTLTRKTLPHVTAIIFFFVLIFVFFQPLFEGKEIKQHDITQHTGMSKEVKDFRAETGSEALWTNSMFSGMPAYLIGMKTYNNVADKLLRGSRLGFIPGNAANFLIALVSFYILLLAFRVNPWLCIVGAIAFTFSSYFVIITEAGHTSKAIAMAFMPLVLAGVVITVRRNLLLGAAITAVALALQLRGNHPQITYYTFIIVLLFLMVEGITLIRAKDWSKILKAGGLLVAAVIVALGTNASILMPVNEYSKQSMRGPSELVDKGIDKKSGLDKEYALEWSYGIGESFTLLIPNFHGGSSNELLWFNENSNTFRTLQQGAVGELQQANPQAAERLIQSLSNYFGDMRFTSGPVYLGAAVMYLFFLGLFLLKGRDRWWLLAAAVLSLLLSWGRYNPIVTNFFFDYVPLYNKFRSVSMTLVITQMVIAIMAMLALAKIFTSDDKKLKMKAWKYGTLITGGLALLFVAIPSLAGLSAGSDVKIIQALSPMAADNLLQSIHADRAAMVRNDALRSLVIILIASGLTYVTFIKKLPSYVLIAGFGILILVDLWAIDRRYLNNDNFAANHIENTYQPTEAFLGIQYREFNQNPELESFAQIDLQNRINYLKRENPSLYKYADPQLSQNDVEMARFRTLYKQTHFRVFNLSVSTWNDSYTSYFLKSIGGYHGAKLGKYQELISHQLTPLIEQIISQQIDPPGITRSYLLNMLNTRYIIFGRDANAVLHNPNAFGNAWFTTQIEWVDNANEELEILSSLTPGKVAINSRFRDYCNGVQFTGGTESSILLESYVPNRMTYRSSSTSERLAVFSEVYYNDKKGWTAYIDNKPVPHIRVNYLLRGLRIPAGDHVIEFKFEPKSYIQGEKISLAFSIILVLGFLGAVGLAFARGMKSDRTPDESPEE